MAVSLIGEGIIIPGLSIEEFDFGAGVPTGWTYAGTGVRNYRDVNGVWRAAPSSTARAGQYRHYPDDSGWGGFYREPSATNKMASYNANPTDMTGWTKGGDASGTASVISDPATLLQDAGLHVLCSAGNLREIDGSGAATDTYIDGPAFGNTNNHVVSAWVYGTGYFTRTGGGTPERRDFDYAELTRIALKVTPNDVVDQFRIGVEAGDTALVIFEQVEQGNYIDADGQGVPTSPIITAGSTASRTSDRMYTTNAAVMATIGAASGGYMLEWYPMCYGGATIQYLLTVANGATTFGAGANYFTIRLNNDNGYTRAAPVSDGTAATQVSLDKPRLNFRQHIAIGYNGVGYDLVTQVNIQEIRPVSYAAPIGPFDRAELGALHGGSTPAVMVVGKVRFYSAKPSIENLVSQMVTSDDLGGAYLGQSNGYGIFRSTPNNDNTGQRAAIPILDQYRVESERNWLINACTNGSALLAENDGGSGYWIDDGGVAGAIAGYGNALLTAEKNIRGWIRGGGAIPFLVWNQGNGGIGAVAPERHKAGLLNVAQFFWNIVGEVPFILDPLGRRTSAVAIQPVRDIYYELHNDPSYPLITLAPDIIDADLADAVHYEESGYAIAGARTTRYALSVTGYSPTGGVFGSRVIAASRSGANVTIDLGHESGATDFTPSSDIKAIYFHDDGVVIPWNSLARSDADTIVGELSSTPTGEEIIYVYYSSVNDVDDTEAANDLVRDNNTNGLLLRGGSFPLPYSE